MTVEQNDSAARGLSLMTTLAAERRRFAPNADGGGGLASGLAIPPER